MPVSQQIRKASESTPIPFTPLRRHLDGALHIPRLELRGAEIAQSRVDPDPVVEALYVLEDLERRPLITPDELMRWTGSKTGALIIHDGRALALPSRDVSETFVAGMLGMTSPEAERHMMEDALARRETRHAAAPPVWTGAGGAEGPKTVAARADYTPEGF